MTSLKSLRAELDELRAEIHAKLAKPAEPAGPESDDGSNAAKPSATLDHQISELNKMVKTMLEDAETTINDHPVATVAGALALGIIIGRLTVR